MSRSRVRTHQKSRSNLDRAFLPRLWFSSPYRLRILLQMRLGMLRNSVSVTNRSVNNEKRTDVLAMFESFGFDDCMISLAPDASQLQVSR